MGRNTPIMVEYWLPPVSEVGLYFKGSIYAYYPGPKSDSSFFVFWYSLYWVIYTSVEDIFNQLAPSLNWVQRMAILAVLLGFFFGIRLAGAASIGALSLIL